MTATCGVGGTGDAFGLANDNANVRSVDPSTGLPTSVRTCSWNNLYASLGLGGFNGYAVHPLTGTRLIPVSS
jgi:hypothetical protein